MKRVFFIFLLINFSLFSQKKSIEGFVTDSLQNPLLNATILIKDNNGNYSYGITNKLGKYNIEFKTKNDTISIEIRSIGYQKFYKQIAVKNEIELNVILPLKTEKLKEIIVESKRKIKVDKDTITYNLPNFINKTEESLEDVIKKLPGLDVSNEGTITFNGKSIEKILIEGEDLVSKNYKILSKNLDANLLKNVQILRNHNDNPLKKKFTKSEKIAINISIKDNKKNILFGTVKAGAGTSKRYNTTVNIGFLKKQIKLLQLSKLNNNGYLSNLTNTNVTSDEISLHIDENKSPLINIETNKNFSTKKGFLNDEEAVLNKSNSNSLTLSKKLSPSTTLRFLTFYNKDDIDFEKNSSSLFNIKENPVLIQENILGANTLKDFTTNMEVKFYNEGNWYLTFENEIKKQKNNWLENLSTDNNFNTLFKNKNNNEKLYVFNHFRATYRPSKYFILENYLYQTTSNLNETYFTTASRFNFDNGQPIHQTLNKNNNFLGWKSKVSFKKSKQIYSLNTLIEKENYFFNNHIKNTQNNTNLITNNVKQNIFNIGLQLNFEHNFNNYKKIKLEATTIYKTINDADTVINRYVFPNVKINYNFRLGKLGSFNFSYNYKYDLLNLNYFFNGFVLKDYRTLNEQIRQLEVANINTLGFSHNIQKLDKGFLTFTISSLSIFDKSLGSNSIINTNSSINNFIFFTK
ncbi:carboxypeptidase-like regulatory domain-containing protein [Polaribacter tangerinus]|uniref:carboxypeptidase-like regulatory domain-containing protein n=1 Tax=Polaribacter tangerinus TaxID=1920034 RepID=UPI000B4AF2DD|nr:carboxypeptidase-like regulatory domain-containing protein [Polaribacter tangerinus]